MSTAISTVVGESRSRPTRMPVYDAARVFAISDVLAICRTRSERGLMLHGSTKPAAASSSDRASEM
jgi:hypothetical protein